MMWLIRSFFITGVIIGFFVLAINSEKAYYAKNPESAPVKQSAPTADEREDVMLKTCFPAPAYRYVNAAPGCPEFRTMLEGELNKNEIELNQQKGNENANRHI